MSTQYLFCNILQLTHDLLELTDLFTFYMTRQVMSIKGSMIMLIMMYKFGVVELVRSALQIGSCRNGPLSPANWDLLGCFDLILYNCLLEGIYTKLNIQYPAKL